MITAFFVFVTTAFFAAIVLNVAEGVPAAVATPEHRVAGR